MDWQKLMESAQADLTNNKILTQVRMNPGQELHYIGILENALVQFMQTYEQYKQASTLKDHMKIKSLDESIKKVQEELAIVKNILNG